jgi:hypothetical protein
MVMPTPIPAFAPVLSPLPGIWYCGKAGDDVDCAELVAAWVLAALCADDLAALVDAADDADEEVDVCWSVVVRALEAGSDDAALDDVIGSSRTLEEEPPPSCLMANLPERARILRFGFVTSERTIW